MHAHGAAGVAGLMLFPSRSNAELQRETLGAWLSRGCSSSRLLVCAHLWPDSHGRVCRHCIGTKRGRDRRSVELRAEKQPDEVNVACEAQPPRGEKNRAKASFGGVASGLSNQSDTTHEGLQEMASPAPAADDALPFGEAPRFCTLCAFPTCPRGTPKLCA